MELYHYYLRTALGQNAGNGVGKSSPSVYTREQKAALIAAEATGKTFCEWWTIAGETFGIPKF